MLLGVCEMCGANEKRSDMHHALPRFLGGTNEEMVTLCKKCHKKADGKFLRLLLNPFGENDYGIHKDRPERRKEYNRQYYQKYKEQWKEYNHEWYQKHKEQMKEYRRKYWSKYYQEHKEQRLEYHRKYREKHREQIRAYDRKYNQEKRKQRHPKCQDT